MDVSPSQFTRFLVAAALLTPCLASCGSLTSPNSSVPGVSSAVRQAADDPNDRSSRRALSPNGGAVPISLPLGLAVSKKNDLYVANHAGTCDSTSCVGQVTVYSDKGVQIPSKTIKKGINNPAGLAFDHAGHLYVADVGTHTVVVFDANGTEIKGRTMKTDPNFTPSGVQIDSSNNVWVANRNDSDYSVGEIQVFNPAGKVIHTITQGLVYPVGIAFSAQNGDAWVGDSETPNCTMTVYSSGGALVKSISTPGFLPTYLAFSKDGRLYVTNGRGSSIEVFNKGKLINSITDGVSSAYGIAFDKGGNFFAANVGNNTITEYSPTGKLIATIN
jgi:sugar lactone lactonase YvrE